MQIVPYDPSMAAHFIRLNRAWIERDFQLEAADLEVFADPGQILRDGGTILFARLDEEIVGTGALIDLGAGTGEIVKMAVEASRQGRGIGCALLEALIRHARERGFRRLEIETSSKLPPALRLYQRLGFREQPKRESSHGFGRADVFLELDL